METRLFHRMEEIEDIHWWFAARREIILSLIRKKINPPAGAAILDAGCGTGANLRFLKDLGAVTGMDSDATALELAGKKGVGAVVKGMLPDPVPFPEASFDLVTLLDVLEHLDQDQESLETVKRLLKPGGHLLITVPAFQFLWSEHDEANHHKRRYLLPELRKKISGAGLNVRYISYFNAWLFPLVVLMRGLKMKSGGGEKSDDLWLPPAPVNAILRKIFGSEKHLIGRIAMPFGVSIIACAQKS